MFNKGTFVALSMTTVTVILPQQCMNQIERSVMYAPWRDVTYNTVAKDFQTNNQPEVCPFCIQCAAQNDAYYLILARAKHHFILMNAYPYSKGHLLIIPYAHVPSLEGLSPEAHCEMIDLTVKAMNILKEMLNPEGFNVGFNFGSIAGASVPHHLHIQVVPRYPRNLAFLDIIGNTTLITFDMQQVYKQLLGAFQLLNKNTYITHAYFTKDDEQVVHA